MLAKVVMLALLGLNSLSVRQDSRPAPKIVEIVVRGNSTLNATGIIIASGLRVGESATVATLDQARRNLLAEGNFDSDPEDEKESGIKITSTAVEGGVRVTIDVREVGVVRNLAISGSGPIGVLDIIPLLRCRQNRMLNLNELRLDVAAIQKLYAGKGYLAVVNTEGFGLKNGTLSLPIVVGKVGEYQFGDVPKPLVDDLMKHVALKPGDYFHRPTMVKDLRRIARICEKHGFTLDLRKNEGIMPDDPTDHMAFGVECFSRLGAVDIRLHLKPKTGHSEQSSPKIHSPWCASSRQSDVVEGVDESSWQRQPDPGVAIRVELSPSKIVQGVIITGTGPIPQNRVRDLVQTSRGSQFRSSVLRSDVARIRRYYADRGYVAIDRTEKNSVEDGIVDAHIQIVRLEDDFQVHLPQEVADEVRGRLQLHSGDYLYRPALPDDLRQIAIACERHGFHLNLHDLSKVTYPPDSPIHGLPEGVEIYATIFDARIDFDVTELPPTVPNRPIDDELAVAVKKRDLSRVQSLLRNGANPNCSYKYNYLVVDMPKTGYCSLLLPAIGWDKRWSYCGSEIPFLPFMVNRSDVEITKALLDAGAEPNRTSGFAPSPMEVAVQHCDPQIVKLLLDAGASIRPRSGHSSYLLDAAENARSETIMILLDRKLPVDDRDRSGNTPLICASSFRPDMRGNEGRVDQLSCVKQLLDHGANIDAQDNEGMTALMKASRQENCSLVAYLTERGAKTTVRDKEGKTAADHMSDAIAQRVKYAP